MAVTSVEMELGGRRLRLETGRIARQADGAVLVQYADTVVLVAACCEPPKEPVDFFPLRMDYREMTYAAGKFPGGFYKREGRPTQKEILTARLMDRPVRPLFPDGYNDEVVVTGVVLSADRDNDPDILSVVGASAALCLAPEVPFGGPIGAVRVGKVNGKLVLNPTHAETDVSAINIVVAGTEKAITMIEGQAKEISEDELLEVIHFAEGAVRDIARLQRELMTRLGIRKREWVPPPPNPIEAEMERLYFDRVMAAHQVRGKFARLEALDAVLAQAVADLVREGGPSRQDVVRAFQALERKACRSLILEHGKREDGRGADELREVTCEVGVLPRVHGSALFTRGETQALVTCTLGTSMDEQRVDGLKDEYTKKFMLDYNFPPFCVGEAKPTRAPSRREIGHGNLAERSMLAVLPPVEKFPYTIRVVSDIMESNGSSSMASVCGATLCMMDAGVPLRQPVAGVAMGLVQEGDRAVVLTDICGSEDHFGDMDLKIAGTQNGVTGVQMDLKISGVSNDTLLKAFRQARVARIEILRRMLSVIGRPRDQISRHAPRLLLVRIPEEKIGTLIGPGGKTVRKIQEETGATIDIEDNGTVNIAAREASAAERARQRVLEITTEPAVGQVYTGKVISIRDFGAFVEILPGTDGLVHISELADGYVRRVEDVCKVGDEMRVKIISIDEQGRIRLSRKAALKEEGASGASPAPVPKR